MRNVILPVIVFCFAVFCALIPAAFAGEESESAAAEAAQQWLALIDDGKYEQSWDSAAGYFRGAVDRNAWQTALNGYRKPFGKVLSRELRFKESRQTMPGAPDGKYVLIQFLASFEHKKQALETVTPMLDSDGKWRVAGYYIR